MMNCIPLFYMDVITYACPNPDAGSGNLLVNEAPDLLYIANYRKKDWHITYQ